MDWTEAWPMVEYGEWNRKGAVLSDVTAKKDELRKINQEIASLKKRMAELEARKAGLKR